jgi:hypothetical protein
MFSSIRSDVLKALQVLEDGSVILPAEKEKSTLQGHDNANVEPHEAQRASTHRKG